MAALLSVAYSYKDPVERTRPILDLSCHVFSRDGRRKALGLRISGGRGYMQGELAYTAKQEMTVVRDEGGIFRDAQPLVMDGSGALFGVGAEQCQTETRKIFVQPVGEMMGRQAEGYKSIAIRSNPDGEPYLGFCDVTEIPQVPLSAEEFRKLPQ